MSQKLYVIVDKNGKVVRKLTGSSRNLGVFVSKSQAEKQFARYGAYLATRDDYKIVEYSEVIE